MTTRHFSKMPFVNGTYAISKRAKFKRMGSFKTSTVELAIEFAFNMTFGSKGEHRHSRSGGSISRGNHQIFANTFQGKLSEFAFANVVHKHKDFKTPDLSTHGLGVWEDADFELGDSVIAVKSTKSYGNLILLESKDWDSSGKYLASVSEHRTYSHIILVRIKPDIEEVFRGLKLRSKTKVSLAELNVHLLSLEWEYDIPGFITKPDLTYIINKGFVIPKGAVLNHSVKMDAENYYVQAGELRPMSELLAELEP